jgi:hypothetical protein
MVNDPSHLWAKTSPVHQPIADLLSFFSFSYFFWFCIKVTNPVGEPGTEPRSTMYTLHL